MTNPPWPAGFRVSRTHSKSPLLAYQFEKDEFCA
jgi:hypothetical protein